MKGQRSIVTVTINPAVDLTTRVDVVTPERKLRCVDPCREPGGGGINVSRAIRRMGGTSTAIHTAGGPTGAMLGGLLDDEEVERRAVESEGWTRENVIVDETSTGRQYRFCLPGPALREPEWRAVLDLVAGFDPAPAFLVASGSLPPGVPEDFYAELAGVAAETGSRVVLDTSGPPLRKGAEAGVFLLKPNLNELADLVDRPVEGEDDQEEAASRLVAKGRAEAVVLSLGAAAVTTPGTELCRGADVRRIHAAMTAAA